MKRHPITDDEWGDGDEAPPYNDEEQGDADDVPPYDDELWRNAPYIDEEMWEYLPLSFKLYCKKICNENNYKMDSEPTTTALSSRALQISEVSAKANYDL